MKRGIWDTTPTVCGVHTTFSNLHIWSWSTLLLFLYFVQKNFRNDDFLSFLLHILISQIEARNNFDSLSICRSRSACYGMCESCFGHSTSQLIKSLYLPSSPFSYLWNIHVPLLSLCPRGIGRDTIVGRIYEYAQQWQSLQHLYKYSQPNDPVQLLPHIQPSQYLPLTL